MATRVNHKLSYKYFGPFQILQKVGAVAYKLQLPASANIHPVFHVSQLKSSLQPNCLVSSTIPAITNQYPLQVVKRRTISRGGRPVNQVLVHWSNSDDVLDSWEDEDALRQQFPRAAAWGQAASQERGYVRRLKTPEHRDAEKELREAEMKMGRGRRVRRPSGRFPSDVWTK